MNAQPHVEFTSDLETAELAVAAVKDPRLREIAFGRILDHLLTSKEPKADCEPASAKPKPSTEKAEQKRSSSGVTAWLRELVDERFFSEPKSMSQILEELSNRSHHLRAQDLTKQLQCFCHDKALRRRKQAPADGKREVFHWSNWA